MKNTFTGSPILAAIPLLAKNVRAIAISSLFFSALLTLVILAIFRVSFSSFEDQVGGVAWRFITDRQIEERITIVAIDERSISEIGPWPWSRDVMAELTDKIQQSGAQLQIHDIVYPESELVDDAVFAEALLSGSGSIISQLPILGSEQSIRNGVLSHAVTGAGCGTNGPDIFPSTESFIGVSAALSDVPKGHIAPIIEPDGAIRKMPALVCVQDRLYPALPIAPFFAALSTDSWDLSVEKDNGLLSPDFRLLLNSYPGLEIPLDSEGNLRFSFVKSPSAFRSVSAIDVIEGNFNPDMFDNVWVLVGATAFALDDVVPTPYSGSAPGIELQARMIVSLLDNNVPYVPQGKGLFSLLIALSFAVLLFFLSSKRGRFAILGLPSVSVMAPAVSLFVHGFALHSFDLWLGWLAPTIFGAVGGLLLLLVELVRLRFERGRVMQNLASYLPSEEARKVAFELPSSNIKAVRQEVTLLCADLRNFSAIGESRPPEESASVLHFFFTKVNKIIEGHGGKIHEYKGDSVLAVWDGNGVQQATSALLAARQIEREINDALSSEIGILGIEPLAVGVGIEQGPVLMGSIGPAHRRAHALFGETVSITLRIQEMTADLASTILIGEVAARHLGDFDLQSLGSFLLAGLTTTHTLFAPDSQVMASRDSLTLLKGGLG